MDGNGICDGTVSSDRRHCIARRHRIIGSGPGEGKGADRVLSACYVATRTALSDSGSPIMSAIAFRDRPREASDERNWPAPLSLASCGVARVATVKESGQRIPLAPVSVMNAIGSAWNIAAWMTVYLREGPPRTAADSIVGEVE